MTVPVLIIPVLSHFERLLPVVESIGVLPERIVIIDNGDRYWVPVGMPAGYENRATVISPGRNLGYAASINLGLKANPDAAWWLLGQVDLCWGPGDIARLCELMDEAGDVPTVGLLEGLGGSGINAAALRVTGYLDENYHPCYCEDCDWVWRARLAGVDFVDVGFTGTHMTSLTIREDRYHQANARTYPANVEYHARKWGGPPWSEVFTTPFDAGGDIRAWTLDPERLTTQAW